MRSPDADVRHRWRVAGAGRDPDELIGVPLVATVALGTPACIIVPSRINATVTGHTPESSSHCSQFIMKSGVSRLLARRVRASALDQPADDNLRMDLWGYLSRQVDRRSIGLVTGHPAQRDLHRSGRA